MDYGKYIIVETMGHETAIMFDSLISHNDFTDSFLISRVKSAGFFVVKSNPTKDDPDDISVGVWGESVTLKIKSKKEDEILLKRVLRKEEFNF